MKTRFQADRGLTSRMLTVMLLLVALYVGFMAVMTYLGIPWYFALIFGVGGMWVQWYSSDSLALRAMKAQVVTPEQAPELHALVDRLCIMADMPKPRVAIAQTDVPNAFATGRSPSHAAVCVTTGLLRRLTVEEVEAVVAHELSHVAHRDVTVITIASTFSIIAGWVAQNMVYSSMFRSRDEKDNGGFFLTVIIGMVVAMLVQFIGNILIATLSRYRELGADRGAAVLTAQPLVLANALRKVSGGMQMIPERDLREVESYNAFMFAPALSAKSAASLFSSHPSLEVRLEQLNRIALEIGEVR
jgi:heat shock protein HtpX